MTEIIDPLAPVILGAGRPQLAQIVFVPLDGTKHAIAGVILTVCTITFRAQRRRALAGCALSVYGSILSGMSCTRNPQRLAHLRLDGVQPNEAVWFCSRCDFQKASALPVPWCPVCEAKIDVTRVTPELVALIRAHAA